MTQHKTSAWPLALVYGALILYASLYPFADWRDQGIAPWDYLRAPLPLYWTGFDIISNVLGYMPLGFLLALSALRTGRGGKAVGLATLAAGILALGMETLQSYLPTRVPSNLDLALNLLGALLGALMAALLEKLGAIARWSRFRERWFLPDARGALVLLVLWPVALLFPAAVPFGLGQVVERLELALSELLQGTPFLAWLPEHALELKPMVPGAALVCVMLGVLIPCLLGFCVILAKTHRALFVGAVLLAGVGSTALSAAMSYGPVHAWAWLSVPTQVGLGTGVILALMLLPVPSRVSAALMLLALGIYLSVLNQAPASAYFWQTLQTWEQGRFIRFHGLAQWLGWLWPYAALLYVLTRVWAQPGKTKIPG